MLPTSKKPSSNSFAMESHQTDRSSAAEPYRLYYHSHQCVFDDLDCTLIVDATVHQSSINGRLTLDSLHAESPDRSPGRFAVLGKWALHPSSLSRAAESVAPWPAFWAEFDAIPRLPIPARAYFERLIIEKARMTAEISAELRRHSPASVSMLVWVRITGSSGGGEAYKAGEGRGISEEAMDEFVAVEKSADDGECPVCLAEIKKGSTAGRMPCGHVFHRECVTRWLRVKGSCPMCRLELPEIWRIC